MKKIITISGLTLAIISVITSVTPLYKLSLIPVIAAIICLSLLVYIKKKTGSGTKFIQYIGILSTISIGLVIYKTSFSSHQVEKLQELQQGKDKFVKDSIALRDGIEIEN